MVVMDGVNKTDRKAIEALGDRFCRLLHAVTAADAACRPAVSLVAMAPAASAS
jgi:hypothetical protein